MQSLGFEAKNQTIFQMISDLDKNSSGAIDFEYEGGKKLILIESSSI